ncbi:MAG: hypothetical protein AAGC55_08050 [Myxococcota bacterium]
MTGNTLIEAGLSPAGDEDVYAISNPGSTAQLVALETFSLDIGYNTPCDNSVDTVITIRDAAGGVLVSDDDDGSGYCSFLTYTLAPGQTVYAQVSEYGDDNGGSSHGYFLELRYAN